MSTPPSKSSSYVARTIKRSTTPHPHLPLLPHIPSLTKERQPLIDVFEEEDYLIVSAELPGIDGKDMNIKADENTVTITAENGVKKYLRKVWLPTSIKKGAIKSTYRNNILQVKLEKLNATKHD